MDESFKLLGRWGTWNYKNMDLCILDAIELANQLERNESGGN
jgi:UDP-galactopyranose mutase